MIASLVQQIADAPLLRAPLPEAFSGRVILTGSREKWGVVRRILEKRGCTAVGVYDKFSESRGDEGFPSISNDAASLDEEALWIFAGRPSKKWFDGCEHKLSNVTWFDPPGPSHQRMGHQPDIIAKYLPELEHFYARLEDDESRLVLASILRARMEGNAGYYRPAAYREYLHPAVQPEPGEIVIDAGAFTGDTAERFSEMVGPLGRIVSVEASSENFSQLASSCVQEGFPNVVPWFGALWSSSGLLTFDAAGGGSGSVSAGAPTVVPATTLDDLSTRLNLSRVDLIKMDIEGAEAAALNGAAGVIREYAPKLQISLYHNANDLWSLPALIDSLRSDYKFYLGHHNFYHTETDLYCVARS